MNDRECSFLETIEFVGCVFGSGGDSQGGAPVDGGNGGSGGGALLEADGCGCHTAPVRSHWGLAALFAVALAFVRRRANRG